MSYIVKYLVEILFAILTSMIIFMYNKVKKMLNTIESNKKSMLVLCKNLFVQKYYYYKRENYICVWEKEALKSLYFEYKQLGGNGIVDQLFKEIDSIPIIKEEEFNYLEIK